MAKNNLSEIQAILKRVTTDRYSEEQIATELALIKKEFVRKGQSQNANGVWCTEQILKIQTDFLHAFQLLQHKEYYNAWCLFDQIEINIGFLRPHYDVDSNEYMLLFIDTQTKKYQKIFPYKIFMSPELLEEEKKCNICNRTVSIRKPCGHEVGELYDGEMCCRIVTKVQILGTAMVESPLQKYSVPFLVDNATGNAVDHYNYEAVEYLVNRLKSPFDAWNVEIGTKVYPHSHFRNLGRNDKCPCGSGKKYKQCCIDKKGVELEQYDFLIEGYDSKV